MFPEDSAWSKIVAAIKAGKNLELNVYFNFHLTRRRSALLYEMRQLKKSGAISKFFSDENGQLTVMVKKKEEGGVKQKVSYFFTSKDRKNPPKTMNKSELLDLVKNGGKMDWAAESE